MQREFWKDTGRTSDAGATLGILLPTPTQGDSRNAANATATRHNQNSQHHSGTTLVDATRLSLISSVADSPASLFQWLEPDAGRVMSVGCGTSFAKLSESSDPDTCWLKTSQDCSVQRMLLDDEGDCLEEWSETWPHWGTMLNGVCYRQRPLVRRISAREYSLLPTPQHHDSRSQGMQREVKDGRITAANGGKDVSINLGTMGMMGLLPTPTAPGQGTGQNHADGRMTDWGGQHQRDKARELVGSETAGGLLHPRFVSLIMGFPADWCETESTCCDA